MDPTLLLALLRLKAPSPAQAAVVTTRIAPLGPRAPFSNFYFLENIPLDDDEAEPTKVELRRTPLEARLDRRRARLELRRTRARASRRVPPVTAPGWPARS